VSLGAKVLDFCRPWLARMVGIPLLAAIALIAMVGRAVRGTRKKARPDDRHGIRLLIVGGFFSSNWFRSHILPLAAAESIDHIVVVCHAPLFPVEKVVYDCPPPWLARPVGKGLAKILWFFRSALRNRPDVFMGYHIMPNALACLVAAAVFGGKAIYQMTGGPIQILGGGFGSEGGILRHLGRPSPTIERLLCHLVRLFDLVVVRGRRAREFLVKRRLSKACAIITGSVDTERFSPRGGTRDCDIVYVSRLVPHYKGLEYFMSIMASLVKIRPSVCAAIVGDGPLLDALQRTAGESGLTGNIKFLGGEANVPDVLCCSKLFMLVSPNEGMSIAMLEAMSAGLPAIVTDVGELHSIIEHGKNGFLVKQGAAEEVAILADGVLRDPERLSSMSQRARETVLAKASVAAVAKEWDKVLTNL
jgi:glycosyltransferase involved in cell wall biosynthesis